MGVAGTPKGKTPVKAGATPKNTPKNVGKNTPKVGKAGSDATANKTPKPMTPKQKPEGLTPKPSANKVMTPKQKAGSMTPKAANTPKGKLQTPKAATPQGKKQVKNTPTVGKGSKTPQPQKNQQAKQKTPKSAPPAHIKRKKLEEEIDDEISDEDFEALLGNMKEKNKKKGQNGKNVEEEDEDDESDMDDEEDDDEDMDEDESDDEDEESDDDDESDDEEETPAPKQALKRKADAPVPTETKKAKAVAAKPQVQFSKAERERNNRTLFVKHLPNDITVEAVKALSKDIQKAQLRMSPHVRGNRRGFAYLEFKDEATAVKNQKVLGAMKIKNKTLFVDYVGEKSVTKRMGQKFNAEEIDPLKLYVTGFDGNLTKSELKDIFPTSSRIEMPKTSRKRRSIGFAFVYFETAGATTKALAKAENKQIRGRTLVVLPGKISLKRKAPPADKNEPAAKKMKKEEEEEDDEDSEEEDEDDDDDEDDDEDDDDDDDDEEEEEDDDE